MKKTTRLAALRWVPRAGHLWIMATLLAGSMAGGANGLLAATKPPATATTATTATSQPAPATVPLTPKALSEQQTLEFLKINEPDVYRSAMLLKDKDNKKFEALMHDMSADVKRLLELDKRNHPMFVEAVADRQLGYHALQLAKDIRNESLPQDVRKQKSEDLRAVVGQQFDVRRRLRNMEIDEMSARINKLQEQLNTMKRQIDDRDQRKDDLVSQRLKELLSTNPKVEW